MKKFLLLVCLSFLTLVANAQEKIPELEYVCELKVKCDPAYSVGKTSHGKRVIIPIVGGSFEGPKLKGTVVRGGADYQLVDENQERTELKAIYDIKTDDGVYIHVCNEGILSTKNGNFYFRTAPKFEAPNDSKYDWLNHAIFVCIPQVKDYISLKVWRVK